MLKYAMVVIRKPHLIALFEVFDRTSPHFLYLFAAHTPHFLPFFAAPHRTFCYLGEVRYRTFRHFLPHLNIAPARTHYNNKSVCLL